MGNAMAPRPTNATTVRAIQYTTCSKEGGCKGSETFSGASDAWV